jgi:putative MATE family efflux protein
MKKDGINRTLIRIGFPVFTGMLVGQIQQITDQAFLGHASAEYLTAVGNAGYTIWTTISFLFSLGTGAAILVSQKIGEKKPAEAEAILGSTFVFSSAFSIFIFLIWAFGNRAIFTLMGLSDPILGYTALYARICTISVLISGFSSAAQAVYNGTGSTRPVMITSILRAGINAGLDWVLIFGHFGFPAMGIAGAAIATLTADLIGGAYSISQAFSKKLPVRLSFAAIRKASLKTYLSVIKIGIPAGLEEFAWNAGNIILIRMLNGINPMAAGIYTIVMSITLIPSFFFMATGSAAMTLAGRKTGEGKPSEIGLTNRKAMIQCMAVAGVFLALFAVMPERFASIFTRDQGVIALAGTMLLISSITLFPKAMNIIYGGGIRGMGDTRWMLASQAFGTAFVVAVAYIMIFAFKLSLAGLFLAVLADEAVRAAINGAWFHRKIRLAVDRVAETERVAV